MKHILQKLFSPILSPFEKDNDHFVYKPSQRKILLFVSVVFAGLGLLVFNLDNSGDIGYLFPVIVFELIGLVGSVVGLLGSDKAVAKIWGNR